MAIDMDSLVSFLIMWSVPIIIVAGAYLKMGTDDRKSAKKDFKSSHFIFTIGFLVIGYFFASFGDLLALNTVMVLGISLMIIAGFNGTVDVWKRNKIKSISIPFFIVVAIVALVR